jgi:hypothetical protein
MSFLPDKAIKEFQNIYKRKCGEELSFEDATVKAEDFIRFFDLITKIPEKK